MGGPWEEYQTASAAPIEHGPWNDYAATAATEPAPAKAPGILGKLQEFEEPALLKAIGAPIDSVMQGVGKVISPVTDFVNDKVTGLFGSTPQQAAETSQKKVEELTGSPYAGEVARNATQLAMPGNWVVPGGLAKLGSKGINAVTNHARGNVAEALMKQSQNSERDALIGKLKEKGYAFPPSLVNANPVNTALESFAGKAATKQQATLDAQQLHNALVREELGLPPEAALKDTALEGLKAEPNAVYGKVDALRPQDHNMEWFPGYHDTNRLEQLKLARSKANDYFEAAKRGSTDPTIKDQAFEWKAKAQAIEDRMGQIAEASGEPGLPQQFTDARTKLAKIHEVSRALNSQTGNVNPQYFGRALDKKKPLTGNLRTIGEFDNIFEQISKRGESVPSPDVSHANSLTSMAAGTVGGVTLGPLGMAAAAIPLGRGPVRRMLLSPTYQKIMANPKYAGPVDRGLAQIPQTEIDPMVAAILARQQEVAQ